MPPLSCRTASFGGHILIESCGIRQAKLVSRGFGGCCRLGIIVFSPASRRTATSAPSNPISSHLRGGDGGCDAERDNQPDRRTFPWWSADHRRHGGIQSADGDGCGPAAALIGRTPRHLEVSEWR